MIRRRAITLSALTSPLAACTVPARPTHSEAAGSGLDFDAGRFERRRIEVDGRSIDIRAYEQLPVVSRAIEPSYQAVNVYVPEAYFQGGSVGRYSARTAPIFLPNGVGGYMPAKPGTLDAAMAPPPAPGQVPPVSASAFALSRGFVVVAPGARGRTLRSADGRWTGKAPAAIVDLKAAVRWVRQQAGRMPGNVERIVSNGTSAGGALSALLGASGNHPDYQDELRAAGALEGRDDIFAVSAYCPITNLGHADEAYEWQFNGLREYRTIDRTMLDYRVQRREIVGQLTDRQLELSAELRAQFIAYVNGLALSTASGQPLRLDAQGRGSLRDHLKDLLMTSAQRAIDAGQSLTDRPWLQVTAGRIVDLDFDAYVRAAGRMKSLTAFDGLALESGENQLFGDSRTDARHFTAFAARHGSVPGATRAEDRTVRQMDTMSRVTDPASTVARHWRIRHGTLDRDTSLAIPALLAAAVRSRHRAVDIALPWDRPHSGDYDLVELFDWFESRIAAG